MNRRLHCTNIKHQIAMIKHTMRREQIFVTFSIPRLLFCTSRLKVYQQPEAQIFHSWEKALELFSVELFHEWELSIVIRVLSALFTKWRGFWEKSSITCWTRRRERAFSPWIYFPRYFLERKNCDFERNRGKFRFENFVDLRRHSCTIAARPLVGEILWQQINICSQVKSL